MLNTQIRQLPQLVTSRIRELQWSIEWWARTYSEASLQKAQAYQLYDNAIDADEPHEQLNDLYAIYQMFDDNAKEAWRKWQDAKAEYLALMN